MMIYLNYDNSPRKYTNAFIEYIEEYDKIDELASNLLNWLSDDEVKDFAESNYDVTFFDGTEEEYHRETREAMEYDIYRDNLLLNEEGE